MGQIFERAEVAEDGADIEVNGPDGTKLIIRLPKLRRDEPAAGGAAEKRAGLS